MKGLSFSFSIIFVLVILIACSTPPKNQVTFFDGAMHTVQPGETLSSIARAYEVTPQLLRRVNNIEDPATIRAGSRIFIPGAMELRNVAADQAMEQLADAKTPQNTSPQRQDGLYHTVQPGETLMAISKAYDVPIRTLQRVNVIANASHIESGQRLWIPGGEEVLDVEVPEKVIIASAPIPEVKEIQEASEKEDNVTVKIEPLPTPTPTPKPESAERQQTFPREVKEFGEERFQWPIKDSFRVLLGFSNTPGEKNTGLDLGADIGTPVYSAANGVVDEVGKPTDDLGTSLGNYIIIHHGKRNNKNIFSIYAHLESTTVEKGQKITRGEQIGTMGRTGRPAVGERGVLHFEIRESYVAIDPREVLPPLN